MWKTCGYLVESMWKTLENLVISGVFMWKQYKQNTTCKSGSCMHIIFIQEDSMSGGCVFLCKEGRIIRKKILSVLNVGLNDSRLCIKYHFKTI